MASRTFEQLGLSRSTVIKLVSCSPVLLLGNDNNAFSGTIEKLKALWFEEDWIGGYLSSNSTYNWNRFLDTLRFDSLVQAGLDFNTVSSMVKQAPALLNQTKDVVEKKINCLKNYLGYSSYLCYDMERIIMRFSKYVWLREKGAAKPTLSVGTLLACSHDL